MRKSNAAEKVKKVYDAFIGDPKKQIRELTRLLGEGKRSGDILLMGAVYLKLSEVYYTIDDKDRFFSSSMKAVALLKDTEEFELIANAYSNLGQAYTNQGSNQMALVSDETAYGIIKKHRIKGQLRIDVLNNISASYHMMGEVRKSIRSLNECIAFTKQNYSDDYTSIAMYSLNLAECYKDNDQPDKAAEVLDSMAEWVDKVPFLPLVCDYWLRRAVLSFSLGNVKAGGEYTDVALGLIPENVYPLPLYEDLRKIARCLSKEGDRARSEKILSLMTVFAEKNKGTIEQIFAVSMAADYYKNFGQYERAAEYYAKYEDLNEKHLAELKAMQLKLHKTMRNTESEIRRLNNLMRKNEELASLEPMTKLLNRSALLRVSSEFIESAAKKKQKVGAIFIDIDFFKECNDTYGHAAGDGIIREVARICKKQEASNVRFARYGGDEFFGITRGLSDEDVCDIARRICRTIRGAALPNEKNPNGGIVTLSAGVVNVPIADRTATVLEIANYADKAVYYAKSAGKNAIYELVKETGDGGSGASYIKIEF